VFASRQTDVSILTGGARSVDAVIFAGSSHRRRSCASVSPCACRGGMSSPAKCV